MRILLVVNASASSVTARTRVLISQVLGADHDLTVAETSRRGHATRLAQGAAADGVDVVAVLGGDGTLNEAANGLTGTSTALGVLPGGSTNVFARTIGTAIDPIEATRQLLSSLASGSLRRVGLGTVNGRYFLFHVGLGFDAAVVAEVENRSLLKRHFGGVVFVAAAAATWRRYDRRSPWFTVTSPGQPAVEAYFGICLNTSPYSFLGNRSLDVAPGTGLDSRLSMVTFTRLTLAGLLAAFWVSLGRRVSTAASGPWEGGPVKGGVGGRSAQGSSGGGRQGAGRQGLGRRRLPRGMLRDVLLRRELDGVEVVAARPVPYQVDGDYLGEAEHLILRYVPDALRLVLPTPRQRPAS